MRLNQAIRLAIGGVALAGTIGAANAAVTFSEDFDGGYFQPATAGQGLLVDYIPTGPGTGQLFLAMFTYDDAGDQYWGATSFDVEEGQFDVSGDFFQFDGGTFGSTPGNTNSVSIGSINVTLNSCNDIDVAFTPNGDGSGLGLSSFDLDGLIPLSGTRAPQQCAYQSEFEGCPSFATELTALDRGCLIPAGSITSDVTLTNDTSWVLGGGVFIGDDQANSANLTIEPGTYIYGAAEGAFLAVSRGSKLFSMGTANSPVVMTSATDLPGDFPVPGDFAGLVVAGQAPSNCNPNCQDEALGIPYGGEDANDSSGILRYTQVRYAGFTVRQDNELNAVTLLGVGAGTEIDYIQAYRGSDDGIEFFGGTVNVNHAVVSGAQDDSYDTSFGYNGKTQYLFIQQAVDTADHVIEADNAESNQDLEPRSQPIISDVTIIQSPNANTALRIRRGTGFILNNMVIQSPVGCVDIDDVSTFVNAGTIASPTGNLAITNSLADCATVFVNDDDDGFALADFFTDLASGSADLNSLGVPNSSSVLRSNGGSLDATGFFNSSTTIGAFDSEYDAWHTGWTFDPFVTLVQ